MLRCLFQSHPCYLSDSINAGAACLHKVTTSVIINAPAQDLGDHLSLAGKPQ